jgi:predicted ATPase
MNLLALSVSNFRAIASLEMTNLPSAVVLAGPNGCGKSCVLDAIRLLKSAFGSYQQDEWSNWFGEFQINLARESNDLLSLFQDPRKELLVSADFRFSPEELQELKTNGRDLLRDMLTRELDTGSGRGKRAPSLPLAANQRGQRERMATRLEQALPELEAGVKQSIHSAKLRIDPAGSAEVNQDIVLELVLSTYEPQRLGIVDYHGPNRNYNRERLGNINLTIESSAQRLRQHALYNYASKYANLKSEMAAAYVRHLIAARAEPGLQPDDALTTTLKELFVTFFPGKEFLGPQPTADGRLLFPVKLANGGVHDIDELSSGEKEVLYGYLRLHNAAPRNSIILIDEPELHLNPRLVSGLAAFYYRHLASRMNNQLWLVTHSDTLIREAVTQNHFAVFHIQPAGGVTTSQATPVKAAEDLERVVIGLVGDLAAYRPGAKVVIFESTSDPAFDKRMTCSLFPEFEREIVAISAGDKRRVEHLYDVLEETRKAGHVHTRFYSITDADDNAAVHRAARRFCWDVHHIENYLLEPSYIHRALRSIGIDILADEIAVLSALKSCAEETIPSLITHKMRLEANAVLIPALDLRVDTSRGDAAEGLAAAITRSQQRIADLVASCLTPISLSQMQIDFNKTYNEALTDGSWLMKFRGRDILGRFAGKYVRGMKYEYFRDLIITVMSEDNYQPPGMHLVISQILSD